MLQRLGLGVVAVLCAGILFELALALGAGRETVKAGSPPLAADWVGFGVWIAMLVGVVVAVICTLRPRRVVALFAPAAALFLLVFSLTYDEYYAPSLVRYVNREPSNWTVVVVTAAVAFAIGVATWFRRREGAAFTAVMLLVIIAFNIGIGDGH